jgi:deazaflavin-dependent oxidoreductase (nitroreductase family)
VLGLESTYSSAMTIIASLLGALLIAFVGLVGVLIGGMRAKWPPVVDRVRGMNRRYFAKQQLETAGQPGAYAGVLHHRGRNSGTEYATPVTIKRLGDDFVIAMVYGRRSDWVKNVLAADSVTVELDGSSYELGQPEIVPTSDVADAFSPSDQRLNRLIAIDECVRLRLT